MTDLPAEVRFAKWTKYQHTNATHFARIECGVLLDDRIVSPNGRASDLALATFVRGILQAVTGHGRVSTRAWLGQCPDRKRAANQIRAWIDNGLLESVPSQIDREIDRTTPLPPVGVPAAPPVVELAEPVHRSGNGAGPPRAPVRAPTRAGWVTRFAEHYAASQDGAPVYGKVGKHLRPLIERDGEPAVWPGWQRFCESEKAQFGPAYFAEHAGDFTRTRSRRTDDDIAKAIKAKLAPGPQFPNTWDFATAPEDEQRVFRARGGALAIWNS